MACRIPTVEERSRGASSKMVDGGAVSAEGEINYFKINDDGYQRIDCFKLVRLGPEHINVPPDFEAPPDPKWKRNQNIFL